MIPGKYIEYMSALFPYTLINNGSETRQKYTLVSLLIMIDIFKRSVLVTKTMFNGICLS